LLIFGIFLATNRFLVIPFPSDMDQSIGGASACCSDPVDVGIPSPLPDDKDIMSRLFFRGVRVSRAVVSRFVAIVSYDFT
jgi:hypothetical protein